MQNEKDRILKAIDEKQSQLKNATKQASNWNSGKYKSTGNAQLSKKFLETLKNEIKNLTAELAAIK